MSQQPAPWNPQSAPTTDAAEPGAARGGSTAAALDRMPPAPASPVRVAPQVPPQHVPPERLRTLAYHRLSHADRRHEWWKPLVEGLIGVVVYVILAVALSVPYVVIAQPEWATSGTVDMDQIDQLDPVNFFYLFASVVLMAPAALLARLIMGPRPLGLILSVTGRLRWAWLLKCLLLALVLFVVINGVSVVIDAFDGGEPVNVAMAPGFWWLLLMLVLLVPVQCFAEELVFRGYLAQTIGRWLKHPAWAILLPVPLFMAGHLYDIWGQLSVGVMAVAMGVVTWRTGGLEAGSALHIVNNCTVTLMAMFGLVDMNDTSGGPSELIFTAVLNAGYVALIFRMVRRNPVAVTRTVVLPAPPQLPPLAARSRALAGNRSDLAAYVVDPRGGNYLALPAQFGPYTVRDGQGRPVGMLDVRSDADAAHQDPAPTGASSQPGPPSLH